MSEINGPITLLTHELVGGGMKSTEELSLHLLPPSSSQCSLWDTSRSDRFLRCSQAHPIPAVTFTPAQTMADELGWSEHLCVSAVECVSFLVDEWSGMGELVAPIEHSGGILFEGLVPTLKGSVSKT